MGIRKKHHYIPKFYLKRFSINNEGKLIGLYNHENNTFVPKAQIKHQACQEYLYGKDDIVEAELAKLESSVARLFYYWTEEKVLVPPPEGTNGFIALRRFILYQLFRTPKAGDYVNKAATQALHALIHLKSFQNMDLENYEVQYDEPALTALAYSVSQEHLLDYLKCKFIVNLSGLPFISSDSPVILYNQFIENCGKYTGATALVAKGLQIFYPVHPCLLICFYDPKVYDCGNDIECLSTKSIDDVHQINTLQYLNSKSQLFFEESITKEYVEHIVSDYKAVKRNVGPFSKFFETNERTYFFSSFEDIKINLKLSFFNINSDAKIDENWGVPLRHPSFEK